MADDEDVRVSDTKEKHRVCMATLEYVLKEFGIEQVFTKKLLQQLFGLQVNYVGTLLEHNDFNKDYGSYTAYFKHLAFAHAKRCPMTIKKVGFKFIQPTEHARFCTVSSLRKVLREYERLSKKLDCVDYEFLSSAGISDDHPTMVDLRTANIWLGQWMDQLEGEDVPDIIKEYVAEALKPLPKNRAKLL